MPTNEQMMKTWQSSKDAIFANRMQKINQRSEVSSGDVVTAGKQDISMSLIFLQKKRRDRFLFERIENLHFE